MLKTTLRRHCRSSGRAGQGMTESGLVMGLIAILSVATIWLVAEFAGDKFTDEAATSDKTQEFQTTMAQMSVPPAPDEPGEPAGEPPTVTFTPTGGNIGGDVYLYVTINDPEDGASVYAASAESRLTVTSTNPDYSILGKSTNGAVWQVLVLAPNGKKPTTITVSFEDTDGQVGTSSNDYT